MAASGMLSTLLRSLQTYTEHQDTPRLLGSAVSLLTNLTNPRNLTLLTAQLLTAPAIWEQPEGVRTGLSVISVFHSAARALVHYDEQVEEGNVPELLPGQVHPGGGIRRDEWARAIVEGANEHSPKWRHLLVLSGLISGFHGNQPYGISSGLEKRLKSSFAPATNGALSELAAEPILASNTVAMVVNMTFEHLSDYDRTLFNYELLLPQLMGSAFFSNEGFQSAYVVGLIDPDLVEVPGGRLVWPKSSSSYQQLQRLLSRPLVSGMGPLSRLIAHSVEHSRDPVQVQGALDGLLDFSKSLLTQWRLNKLSSIDNAEQSRFVDQETISETLPAMWQVMKTALFAAIIILRGIMARVLADRALASDSTAPLLASHALHTLRNLYFVTTKLGTDSFTQYTFVYLTALDILSRYPGQSEVFLKEIAPLQLGAIPTHPLDRNLDLYFLNTSEHFTLVLSPAMLANLLIPASMPYLSKSSEQNLLPLFEAGHSVMLSVFCSPSSTELASKHIPFYIATLFSAFPSDLSARQFRLAFKTLMQVAAPPSILAARQPELPATLLELLHHLALNAPPDRMAVQHAPGSEGDSSPISEQAVYVLTMIDSLPYLSLDILEEWLDIAARLVNVLNADGMRVTCRERFWDVLMNGELDPDRSQISVVWWTTKGGADVLLHGAAAYGQEEEGVFMSGALPAADREAKL
ncbi:hypothetical protein P152DRAFT_484911 [Eremomyces bilateralis CBS 781.70]|uniref:Peroxisomal membrane protein Pex17 n=1 Tax=Eremomyces bilateralis CBS 781.70 TaxID=1392243 RepID=A0A6G1FTZ4_9PEZI|nr:uncharacterized protein P152DRAFT_484911 [Eremomyces bilateralis CBS 781.70]KAF1809178.1 hypothetical protein P152DRAFT_484911 [Eremomyces bilateralis CBS 781.70]